MPFNLLWRKTLNMYTAPCKMVQRLHILSISLAWGLHSTNVWTLVVCEPTKCHWYKLLYAPFERTPFDSVFVKWLELYLSVCSLSALSSAALPHGACPMKQVDAQHRAHPHAPGWWHLTRVLKGNRSEWSGEGSNFTERSSDSISKPWWGHRRLCKKKTVFLNWILSLRLLAHGLLGECENFY